MDEIYIEREKERYEIEREIKRGDEIGREGGVAIERERERENGKDEIERQERKR